MSVVAIRTLTETTGEKWTVESSKIPPTREHVCPKRDLTQELNLKTPTLQLADYDRFHKMNGSVLEM